MKERLITKKYTLAVLGLLAMLVTPEIAAHVVALLVPVILGIAAVDYKKESKKDNK